MYHRSATKAGGSKGRATLPLQNQLMPSGILACILLQASRRDNLQGKETSLSERGNLPGKQALRREITRKKNNTYSAKIIYKKD